MPVRVLPPQANLDHLKYQAKDLLKEHSARSVACAHRIREFHPRYERSSDREIFAAEFRLSDAQLTIARSHGFASWTRLKRHVEQPTLANRLELPHHERIEDAEFRRAVDLLDAGDVEGLRGLLRAAPKLVEQQLLFEGKNYFRTPTLLEFIAENPVRHGKLPANVVEVARGILEAGPAMAAHFHGPAAVGAKAPPVLPVKATASPIEGQAVLTDAQISGLEAGLWYFNIHTAANPGGEVRGQVVKDH